MAIGRDPAEGNFTNDFPNPLKKIGWLLVRHARWSAPQGDPRQGSLLIAENDGQPVAAAANHDGLGVGRIGQRLGSLNAFEAEELVG